MVSSLVVLLTESRKRPGPALSQLVTMMVAGACTASSAITPDENPDVGAAAAHSTAMQAARPRCLKSLVLLHFSFMCLCLCQWLRGSAPPQHRTLLHRQTTCREKVCHRSRKHLISAGYGGANALH